MTGEKSAPRAAGVDVVTDSTASGEATGPGVRRARAWARGADLLRRSALLGGMVLLIIVYSIWLPATFPTHGNVVAMLSSQSFVLILALAVTIPLRSGDFDLSVSAVMVFTAAVLGILVSQHHWSVGAAIPVTLAIGFAAGLLNAFFIVKLGINAFIVTLATMTALGGLTFGITNSNIVSNFPHSLLVLGQASAGGLPDAVYYGWVVAIVLWYVFEYTPYGRQLLFVGGSRDASRLAGLRVNRVRISAFVASAVLAAVGGVGLGADVGAGGPGGGPSVLLAPHAAAFLGTTTIQIGRFNIAGTVIASYLLIVGVTGLLLAGASPWVSDLFNGVALLAAVAFARFAARRSE